MHDELGFHFVFCIFQFVLVRNMLSKQVIATTSGRGQLVHEYGLPEAILLPGQVFSVQLPPSTSLQIRDTVVESRISVVDHIQFTSYGEVSCFDVI